MLLHNPPSFQKNILNLPRASENNTFSNRRQIITGTLASQDSSPIHQQSKFSYPELNPDQLNDRVKKIKERANNSYILQQ
jgi:hypothetical protein